MDYTGSYEFYEFLHSRNHDPVFSYRYTVYGSPERPKNLKNILIKDLPSWIMGITFKRDDKKRKKLKRESNICFEEERALMESVENGEWI